MAKILLVEHDGDRQRCCRRWLEACGYCMLAAGSYDQALEELERASPDLVVFEAHLPRTDAPAAVRRILARCPRVPVLVVTDAWQERDRAVREIADACATLSGDGTSLLDGVRHLFNPHAA
jgi:CheY-like chemotaxis protein